MAFEMFHPHYNVSDDEEEEEGEEGASSRPSTSKTVTFDLTASTTNDHMYYEYTDHKIYIKPSAKGILIGEFTILIDITEDFVLNSDSFKLVLVYKGDLCELSIIQVHQKNRLQEVSEANFDAIKSPDHPWTGVYHQLKNYTWGVRNPEDLHKGILNVQIFIPPEKKRIYCSPVVAELFFRKTYSDSDHAGFKNTNCAEDFFKEIQNHQRESLKLVEKVGPNENLLATLCPYQARAVQWMINRESCNLQEQNSDWISSVVDEFTSVCGRKLYYNKFSRMLHVELFNLLPIPPGGILADEMGLGKTVVTIALVLNNTRNIELENNNESFLSPLASNDVKAVIKKSEQFDHDEETVKKNKENSLNADEKLYYTNAKKSALKRALNEWYESKLASYSASASKKPKRSTNTIKCVCGDGPRKKSDNCVQCPGCERFQHAACVGYEKGYTYFCPSCWVNQNLIKAKSTLIIAPASIYNQWYDEIQKHVSEDAFTKGVLMYNGVKEKFIQPSVLSEYDMVITTYAVLGAEFNHAKPNESTRELRNESRFLRQSSPLTQLEWWRVCLDEAQMVESDASSINKMAKMIPAVNRWSVTGTPVQKSVNDIFFLIEWLGVEPFIQKSVWNEFMYLPYRMHNEVPMLTLTSQIFWRSSKEDVADELKIPPQSVEYHFLTFTAIEQNFYMREHASTSADFADRLRKFKDFKKKTIDTLDKQTLSKLLQPLLNLRQACSHPLAVRGNKISTKTGIMTLTQLLEYLSNKTKQECEESLRAYIAALNGLAGLYCIMEDWPAAVDHYRQVLQFSEEYKEKIEIDSLQKIHTLTNLAEVLQTHPEGIPPTLRDSTLKDDVKALEAKYMKKAMGNLEEEELLLKSLAEKVSNLEGKFLGAGIWWQHLIHQVIIDNSTDELMDKIENELATNEAQSKKLVDVFLSKISSPQRLEIMLRNWVSDMEKDREKVLEHLQNLRKKPCQILVHQAVDCHLRTFTYEIKKKKCDLCICESALLDYECDLFAVTRKMLQEKNYEKVLDGAQTKGTWHAHNGEKTLRVILNFGRLKNLAEDWCFDDGKTHIQLLEALKKEFKQLRVVWMSLNHQIQASDEISMSKFRLRLREPGEIVPPKRKKQSLISSLSLKDINKTEIIHVIEYHEVDSQKLKLIADSNIAKSEFRKKYGTLLYLKNLGQDENLDPCPVCKTPLENEWCVLTCGHSFCIDCTRTILSRTNMSAISCPVCREVTKNSDLSFVDLSSKDKNSDINVIGEHSTKVDGVLRALIALKKEDPKVKVLIFSTWAVVLKVLEKALEQNNISYRRMPGYNYQAHLHEFKDMNSNVTALLLPIAWGSKGLNLVEAKHVFLVEPIMNPAEELQAIGRVHRIGQTKETVVHRFLINGSIEEKIHAAVSEAKDKWDKKKVTLGDLQNLFVMKDEFVC